MTLATRRREWEESGDAERNSVWLESNVSRREIWIRLKKVNRIKAVAIFSPGDILTAINPHC